ncbi:MAG: 30S ribosomal protein S16 [Candidatus Staskawiczbacteria bacterium]|nr:30S ribosomal protein S16 [Candidatus Staskawiczbacteria bacterium]
MLTIRLTRKGKKNQPFFRVVVTDKRRSAKGGRSVEDLGYVDPLTKRRSLKKERVLYWISKGAKPSESIHNLLVSEKIIDAKKIHVSKISKKKQAEITASKASADAKAKAAALPEGQASLAPEGAGRTPSETPSTPVETPKEEPQPSPEAPAGEAKPAEEAKPETPAQ